MPSAITSKSALAGTKRKSLPVQSKESKKPKLEKSSTSKSKVSKEAQSKKEPSPSESSEASDSDAEDGGVELDDLEESAKEDHGLHPERAKAVVANSMESHNLYVYTC